MAGGNPHWLAKFTTEQVVSAWAATNQNDSVSKRIAEVSGKLGAGSSTIRRYLVTAGILSSTRAVHAAARKVAAELSPAPAVAFSLARSAGVILADTIQRQRDSVAGLLDTEARLSSMLADLTRGCLDADGNPLPTDEGVIHRAVSSYAKLVDAIDKRTSLERKVWGIRDDEGSTFAQTLEQLAGPLPPSGHPPMQISGTPKVQPSRPPLLVDGPLSQEEADPEGDVAPTRHPGPVTIDMSRIDDSRE